MVQGMTQHESISERLEAAATASDSSVTRTALARAAKKFASYARAPGNRKDADRVAGVLTPEVVAVVGDALVQTRTTEIGGLAAGAFSPEFRESDYALAALLIASGDSELSNSAEEPISRLAALVEQMDPNQAEHVQFVAGLYPELACSTALRTAARARLGLEPETLAASWASGLGLNLPAEYWAVNLAIPSELAEGRADAGVYVDIEHRPGTPSRWSLRLGAINRDVLGADRWRPPKSSPLAAYDRGHGVAGEVPPAGSPNDLPRILRDLEAAHPGLSFEREALKASGSPGRLLSPTKKKLIIAWLSSTSEVDS
ncbi:hypothetical protein C5B85_03405 [Pseudoclavibacter sp. AY1F1]|nr:hypothetical protein C5B85_03405 [Pseudoclavibacter sp. AY1F1]